MTEAARQAFLTALAASANVRLSAAAAGFAHSSFYARASRARAFAREMRLALAEGYSRVEAAALVAALPESEAESGWRRGDNDPPPVPRMTPDQALQLLFLHEKSVKQGWEKPHRRRRRNESEDTYTERLRAMWTAEQARQAEDRALREALWAAEAGPPESSAASAQRSSAANGDGLGRPAGPAVSNGENPSAAWLGHALFPPSEPASLPSLDQVTGWSKASGKPPHNPDLALFGGWRLKDWKRSRS